MMLSFVHFAVAQNPADATGDRIAALHVTLSNQLSVLQQKLTLSQTQSPHLSPYYEQHVHLYKQFILGDQFQTLSSGNPALQSSEAPDLNTLTKQLQTLTDQAKQLERTIEAEINAVQTQIDSKMYYKMRVRAPIPQKALNAYGLMAMATKARDSGKFTEALELWAQAEALIKESYSDHIAHMAEYRAHLKANAEKKRAEVTVKVKALLDDYFVKIPGGAFDMGSLNGSLDEQPRHKVTVPEFYMGKTEVTFELFDYCVELNGCYAVPADEGWGRDQRPVINVSFKDIERRFLPWLNELVGANYRLPTEAEWEYAAKAGANTRYSWGNQITCAMARFNGGSTSICNATHAGFSGTLPVASFKANGFGVFDMHGNAWEWVQDCWNTTYQKAPSDGKAWLTGNCAARVLRGGAWDQNKTALRAANRYTFSYKSRRPNFGFRLAYDQP